jgi:A/G-specific adenine glycosylase
VKNNFSKQLLDWYFSRERDMPWRGETDVYKIWLSEVMLQQTQVETAKPYYQRWLSKFPNTQSVADASEDEVLKLWEGLGYYARARNFKSACEWIQNENNGEIPINSDDFRQLKGVGDYIHAAVRSIAFNEVLPVIDGNVKRVVARIIELDSAPSQALNIIKKFLINEISHKSPGDFNQAIMDLGSTICKPRNPKCSECNISSFCKSYKNNTVDNYPVSEKKRTVPHHKIAVGLIWKENKILISKRHSNAMLGGLWEFPGGKIKKGESAKECVKREIKEELSVNVSVGKKIDTIKHAYTHFTIELTAYHCQYESGEAARVDCADFKWIKTRQIDSLPFPKANHKIFNKIPENNPCLSYVH